MNKITAVIQLITTNLNVNKFIEIYFNALLVVQKTLYLHNGILKCTTNYGKNNSLPPHDKDERQNQAPIPPYRRAEVQLFHKSQIDADLADLKKFEMDGSLKPLVSIYNEKLRIAITREIEAMREAYNLLKDEGRVINFLTEYSVGIL